MCLAADADESCSGLDFLACAAVRPSRNWHPPATAWLHPLLGALACVVCGEGALARLRHMAWGRAVGADLRFLRDKPRGALANSCEAITRARTNTELRGSTPASRYSQPLSRGGLDDYQANIHRLRSSRCPASGPIAPFIAAPPHPHAKSQITQVASTITPLFRSGVAASRSSRSAERGAPPPAAALLAPLPSAPPRDLPPLPQQRLLRPR